MTTRLTLVMPNINDTSVLYSTDLISLAVELQLFTDLLLCCTQGDAAG